MKLSQVVKIIKPEYAYLKLTPNNSIRNQSTYKIARTISSIYKNMIQRIKVEERKLIKLFGKEFFMGTKFSIKIMEKVGYFIYIEKKKIEFYFIVPKDYYSLLEEKLLDVWKNVTIKEVDELPQFSENAEFRQMVYDKEDALSLKVDRRDNDLLESSLNIVNVLDEKDKVGLFYNFIPTTQYTWKHQYKNTIDKWNRKAPIDRNKGKASFLIKYSFNILNKLINEILGAIVDKKDVKPDHMFETLFSRLRGSRELKEETIKKENAVIIKTQIIAISDSENKVNKYNNLKGLTQSFETISGDNKLIPKKVKGKVDFMNVYLKGTEINFISDHECDSFIALPGRDILEEYNFIDKVETKETQVPEDLREGKWRLGVSTFRGHQQPAYLTEHNEYKHLSLFLIGPSRAGKTTLIGNLSYDAINNDECVILFDFIENCEMSTQVASLFPKEKVLNIVCDNKESAQGLGYNEIRYSDDPEQQYINAKSQSTQLSTLINSVNTEDAPLTARMRRYLTSASLVVFLSGGSVKDVFTVLQNHNFRHKFISMVHQNLIEDMQEYLDYLYELDEVNKDGDITGTRISAVEGIISRLNLLKDNPYMELMLKKNTDQNIDLVNEMEKNQLICIKMPESMFNTDEERDVYCIYWMTKIWLSLQIRAKLIPDKDKRKKVNLFVDEMYQVENTEAFMSEKLSRFAKFRLKPIVSCHYLGQLRHMKKELAGANASYVLIAGCDGDNFKELENQLKPYKMEDLINLKEYHALHLIKNKGGYGKFITLLPDKVEKQIKKIQTNSVQLEKNTVILGCEGDSPHKIY